MVYTQNGFIVAEQSNILVKDRHQDMVAPLHIRKLGARILVVDDEPEIVLAVSMRLKAAGYNVIAAFDGIEATRLAIHDTPDLIILDIGMPCGDGHTIARRLSECVTTMLVPVIFLTARTAPAERDKAMSLGACDYITKPFSSERLLTAVEKALDGVGYDSKLP